MRNDLRAGGAAEHGFVRRAEHRLGAIEDAGEFLAERRGAAALGGLRRAQIPIDLVAIGDQRIRLEREPAGQQATAERRRQPVDLARGQALVEALMPAAAGIDHHPQPFRHRVRRWECRKLPRLAQRAAARAPERKLVGRRGPEPGHVELPEIAGRGIRLPAHLDAADLELGRRELRLRERGLDQEPVVAGGRNEMLDLALVPVPFPRCLVFRGSRRSADTRRDQAR